ncbi:hypothetical protein GCM10009584_17030 [Ornithinimicrobium humiphilum]|uniref:Pilus assembly protein Flp/PilA n=1 Tax=Ornithinimicrobium humiphilum TaxID=125288 RepID=A0A543KL34_9MICO|nr:hypothetical protein [Ornithinimicrobium humiphilum]TQM95796.1 hypothetical protein FB476_0646 [Ornithinimicrobium humiphilum]
MKISTFLKRFDRESGQGSLEYLGVIIVAVVIVSLLAATAPTWSSSINEVFQSAVDAVTGKGSFS